MSPAERLALHLRRAQYLRTLNRFVGPHMGFKVRNAGNDNPLPLGAA